MTIFEKIPELVFTALIAPIVIGLLFYYFKKRRLYASIPTLFPHSQIGEGAQTVQISIFNRGNRVEEKISLSIDGRLSINILSHSNRSFSLVNNELTLPRLLPGEEAQVLIDVENGDFSTSSIKNFSSSDVVGKIFKSNNEVPANALTNVLSLILIVFLMLGLPAIGYWMGFDIGKGQGEVIERQRILAAKDSSPPKKVIAEPLKNLKWSKMIEYQESNVLGEFTDQYFPVSLSEGYYNSDENLLVTAFDIENKSEEILEISLRLKTGDNDLAPRGFFGGNEWYFVNNKLVFPNSTARVFLIGYTERKDKQRKAIVELTLETSQATLYNMTNLIDYSIFPLLPEVKE